MTAIKPIVVRKVGRQRRGKGFSREELKKAGLSLREALKLGIPVDSRRSTAHKENVKTVKKFLKSQKKKASKTEKRRKSKS